MWYTFALMAGMASGPRSLSNGPPADLKNLHPIAAESTHRSRNSLITLDYVNAEVRDVIRALSLQSGASMAITAQVKGQVTVHLHDKNVDEAVEIVASLAGLGARKLHGAYVIAPKSDIKGTLERLGTTREIALKHLSSMDAIGLVQSLYPDLTSRPQGTNLVLVGAEEDIDAVAALISQRDVEQPGRVRTSLKVDLANLAPAAAIAVLQRTYPDVSAESAPGGVVLSGPRDSVQAAKGRLSLQDAPAKTDRQLRVYGIKYASATQLLSLLDRAIPEIQASAGPDSTAPTKPTFQPLTGQFVGSGSGGSSGGAASASSGSGGSAGSGSPTAGAVGQPPSAAGALSLVLQGPSEAVDRALQLLALTDVAPRQLMIEARIVETNPALTEEMGFKWNWTRFGFYESPAGSKIDTGTTSGIGGDLTQFLTKNNGIGVFSRAPFSFQAILSAMVTKRDARILASPSISVINDQDASIFIGDTLRFQTLAQSGPNTGSQYTVAEVPVGIILLVHPRINDEGNITLRLHPVVSTVTGLVGGIPQTSSREAESTVRLRDGETIVIGGLLRDEDIREMSKVPVLGDLPLIGSLFRNTSRNHRKTEVMVVLTAHLQP